MHLHFKNYCNKLAKQIALWRNLDFYSIYSFKIKFNAFDSFKPNL